MVIHDLVDHDGETLVAGNFVRDERTERIETRRAYARQVFAGGIATWRDGGWVPQPGAMSVVDHLASAGESVMGTTTSSVVIRDDGHWRTLTDLPRGTVRDLAIWKGRPVIAGRLQLTDGGPTSCLALWDGEAWNSLTPGESAQPTDEAKGLLVAGDHLWVVGRFEHLDGVRVGNIAAWDGQSWHGLAGGVDDEVSAVALFKDGIAVAGLFNRAGDVDCAGLAWWHQGQWQAIAVPAGMAVIRQGPEHCVSAAIHGLQGWGDALVVRGSFRLDGDDGAEIRGLAMLEDDVWRRVPGTPDWQQQASCTPDFKDVPSWKRTSPEACSYFVPEERRYHREPSAFTVDGGQLTVAFAPERAHRESALLRVQAGGTWSVDRCVPLLRDGNWGCKLVGSPLGQLLLGSIYGVGWRESTGTWRPLGDWTINAGSGSSRVEAVTWWRGQPVAIGDFHRIGDEVVRHVARFADGRWQPLGDGLGVPHIASPVATTGDGALQIYTYANRWGVGDSGLSFWCFDGDDWRLLDRPDSTRGYPSAWDVVAHGDTLFASTSIVEPVPDSPWSRSIAQGLFQLLDGHWSRLGRWTDDIREPILWQGRLYALRSDRRTRVCRLVRWSGNTWNDVDGRNLPGDSHRLLPRGRHLVTGGGRHDSWAWDGETWTIWPREQRSGRRWLDGRLYEGLNVYRDPLPPLGPQIIPEAVQESVYFPRVRELVTSLPELTSAKRDSLPLWRLWLPESWGRPAAVKRRGDDGVEFDLKDVCGSAAARYCFVPESGSWYRLRGRLRGEKELAVSLSFAWLDSIKDPKFPWQSVSADHDSRDSNRKIDLIVPCPENAALGNLSLRLESDGRGWIDDLELTPCPDLLAGVIDGVWNQLRDCYRASPELGSELPAAPSDSLLRAARRCFDGEEAERLLRAAIESAGDPRLARHGERWRESGVRSWSPPELRTEFDDPEPVPERALPGGLDPCAPVSPGIDAWLPGSVAFTNWEPASHRPEYAGRRPVRRHTVPWQERARGVVVDLRGRSGFLPAESHQDQSDRFCDRLQQLGFQHEHWARARLDGHHRSLRGPRRSGWNVASRPTVVFVDGETSGVHALAAEALSRLDHVRIIGETTAPLPAVRKMVDVPVLEGIILVPSGTWETPDGRVLTDQTLVPDETFENAGTEDLIRRAKELIAEMGAVTPR